MKFSIKNALWRRFGMLCLLLSVIISIGCPSSQNSTSSPEALNSSGMNSSRDAADLPKVTGAKFVEVALAGRVDFVPRNGREANHLAILESLGTGVGFLDYDLDGMLDLFFTGGGDFSEAPAPVGLPSALFRNRGDLQFENVADKASVSRCPFYSHGVCVGDFDSDGFPDLLITGYRGLLLLRNRGDGTFADVTDQSGLSLKSWSTSAAWGDADGDGSLDLYIANYVDWSFEKHPQCIVQQRRDVCSPREFAPLSDVFYRSNGDGTFRDVSRESGLVEGGKGLGVVAADLDLDGDLDYAVANDTTPNFLYWNDGSGHFAESGLLSGTAFGDTGEAEGSMGIDVGDFNNDGLPDLWVANFENQSFALYRNEGEGRFQHVSAITGITAVGADYVGFGTCFFDFDLDGDQDLFAANGHVMYRPANGSVQQKPLLFENRGNSRFLNVAYLSGDYFLAKHMGRGAAMGDLDRDGDLDLVVTHTNEQIAVLRNDTVKLPRSVTIRLIGATSNRDAIGAMVTLVSSDRRKSEQPFEARSRVFCQQVKGGASYLSSPSREIVFGLEDTEDAGTLEIIWPSGSRQHVSWTVTPGQKTLRQEVVENMPIKVD